MDAFVMEASTDSGKTWFVVDNGDQSFHCIRQARERAKRLGRWERVINREMGDIIVTVDQTGATVGEGLRNPTLG